MKDYDINYAWDAEPQEKKQIVCDNPEIYNLTIKEMNQLIYNKLEEMNSILNCILDVVKEGKEL